MAHPVAARRYAEAAFQVAVRDDRLDRWGDDLARAAEVLGIPEVAAVVDSPAVPLVQRRGLVERLLAADLQPGALNLVQALVVRGAGSALARVAAEYRRLVNAHRGIVPAVVTSAVPLTAEETAKVRERVRALAGAEVDLRTEVDPGLLGGLTVQVRDRLIDASVRGRLERLRAQLTAGGRLR